jgi:hypothetical protein
MHEGALVTMAGVLPRYGERNSEDCGASRMMIYYGLDRGNAYPACAAFVAAQCVCVTAAAHRETKSAAEKVLN